MTKNEIKQRVFSGWNLRRIIYLLLGVMIVAQSIMMNEWFGIIAGSYFSVMGLFALGCAGGYCYGGQCKTNVADSNDMMSTPQEQ